MLLSTSSSKSDVRQGSARKAPVLILLAIIVCLLVAFEIATRVVIERKSKVQRIVNTEYSEAIGIRQSHSGRKQLLVVGNSLVGFDLDLEVLQKRLPSEWQAHRFWIYNTNFDDWYFGLRRLFAEGSRPDVVAIVLAAMNWNATGIRGDYSAQYLFQARDIPAVSSQLDLDRTTAASLLFSRISKAYALRSEVRKVLLDSLMPDLPQMYNLFKPGPPRHFTDEQISEAAARRIEICREIVQRYGAKLVIIVPPIAPPGEEHLNALRAAAARAGVKTAIPLNGREVPAADFIDDVHLTPRGATLFTDSLVKVLVPAMENTAPPR